VSAAILIVTDAAVFAARQGLESKKPFRIPMGYLRFIRAAQWQTL
jgi:hypothetical protein